MRRSGSARRGIMQTSLTLRTIRLPLRHPFTIAHGTRDVQENVLVELRKANGRLWRGCFVCILWRHLGVDPAGVGGGREAASKRCLGRTGELWQRLLPRWGIIASRWRRWTGRPRPWGKRLGRPVHRLWGLDPQNIPPSNYTLGIDTAPEHAPKMRSSRLADLQDQARHGRRLRDRPRTAAAYRGRLPRRCQLFLDRRADHRQLAGVEGPGVSSSSSRCRLTTGRGCNGSSPSRLCQSSPMKAAESRKTWLAVAAASTASTSSWSNAAA